MKLNKKILKNEEEIVEDIEEIIKEEVNVKIEEESVNPIPFRTKNIWYSGFCLTDIYNFAEFGIEELPNLPDNVSKKKFDFDKDKLNYVLGNKVIKVITNKGGMISFDKIKNIIDPVFLEYFRVKYQNISLYWILKFNGKDKKDEMIGIMVEDDLVGVLRLTKNYLKER